MLHFTYLFSIYIVTRVMVTLQFTLQDCVKKLEENVADFGRISENLLTKYGKVL